MRRFLLVILMTLLALGGFSQKKGSLSLDQDSRVERLMRRQREVYAESNTMSGYRIQIFMEIGNEAIQHAESMMKKFKEEFPGIPVYLTYEQPNYRLRVGDFRNRVEAQKYLKLIKPSFNLAFVTADIINPPVKMEIPDIEEEEEDEGEEQE